MPRFFFDVEDGDDRFQDDTGQDLPDFPAARAAAQGALADMARDSLPDGERRIFRIVIRQENGGQSYESVMSIEGRAIL